MAIATGEESIRLCSARHATVITPMTEDRKVAATPPISYRPARMTTQPQAAPTTLVIHADMSWSGRSALAIADLREGVRLWRLAWALGWLDIRLKYRGSVLGPLWLTISTGVMVGSLGVLYGTLFRMPLAEYLPFLALSQVLWFFLAASVSDACASFTEAETVIRSIRMPFSLFAVRLVIRNVLILAHNVIVIVVVFAIYARWPSAGWVLALPGLALWLLNAVALNVLLGALCARFRDITPIINSVMQIAFFLTPVIWKPEQLGPYVWVLPFSPFFDMIEIVRAPLLGEEFPALAWLGALIYSFGLCGFTWWFFLRARGRIAFWL
jgi:lipopolysaccharide transport system permease protein